MMSWPILFSIILMPLAGVLFILSVQDDTEDARRNIRTVALFWSSCTFLISLFLFVFFDQHFVGFQFVEKIKWFDSGISWHLGIDGISIFFVILTTFFTPIAILASWESIQSRVKEYMILFLLLETFMIGVFCSLDIVLFYIFFEACLIPMFIIIGVWGGENRIYAAFKFFLYTFFGSVFMLFAILVLFYQTGTSDIPVLLKTSFPFWLQISLWVAFFVSFAVKIPIWPLHTWLPDAHVQAPTGGSVILAAILLKMGAYGFLRFSLPMFPDASMFFAPFIFFLSVISILYTSFVALMQEDMKKLIAYSSIAHMGYVTMGIFSFNENGISGSIFQMLSHGLIASGLFLCIGVLYDQMHTRKINAYGGIVVNMPRYAVVFLILTMANIGLPGLSGFVGEFLSLLGVAKISFWTSFAAAFGVILSACYGLWLYQRIVMGKLVKDEIRGIKDISMREKCLIYPLIGLIIFLGVYPSVVFDISSVSVKKLIHDFHTKTIVLKD